MIDKFLIWLKGIDAAWKTLFGVFTAVTVIATASIKINRGVELMSSTARDVKEIKTNQDSIFIEIREVKSAIKNERAGRTILEGEFVDQLKLEGRLDAVIRYYERKAEADVKSVAAPAQKEQPVYKPDVRIEKITDPKKIDSLTRRKK